MTHSATVKQVIKMLSTCPKDAKVFLSSDSEGNSYGSVDPVFGIGIVEEDNVVILQPFADHLQGCDVYPKLDKKIEQEYEEKYGKSNG